MKLSTALALLLLSSCATLHENKSRRAYNQCVDECGEMGMTCGGIVKNKGRVALAHSTPIFVGGGYNWQCVPGEAEAE